MCETVVSILSKTLFMSCHDGLQGKIIYMIGSWMFILFLGAADCELFLRFKFLNMEILMTVAVMMILRVWALYNRSKLVLSVLLVLFSLEIISFILAATVNSVPRNSSGM